MADGSGARNVEIDVIANDKTASGTASAARNFSELERNVKGVTQRIGAEGRRAGVDFSGGLLDGVKLASRTASPVLAGVGVAAAPLIAASISAAVLGGAGAGGIIGGVALAARDTRVQMAGELLKERLLGGLETDAEVVIGPLLDAMALVNARAGDFDRIMSRAFAGVADDIGPLTTSLLNAAESLGEGFADAVEGAGPVIAAAGAGIERIADAVGDGFSRLSDNGAEAALAVADVADSVVLATNATFRLVDALTQVYGYARAYGELQTGNVAGAVAIVAAMELQSNATRDLGDGYSFVGEEAEDAANAVKALNDEIFRAANANIGAAEAQLRYTEAVKAARDSVDGLSQVTAEEEGNLLRQATAANTTVESLIAMGASTEQVAAATVRARGDFIGTATAMGLTRQKAEELANSYLAIPETVRTRAVVDAASAEAEIQRLKARLGEIPPLIDVAIRVTQTGASRAEVAAGLRKQNFSADPGRAAGGRHSEAQFMADARGAFRPADPGVRRTLPADPLSVENTVNVTLDGRPFYEMTAQAVSSAQSRDSFWQRAGRR